MEALWGGGFGRKEGAENNIHANSGRGGMNKRVLILLCPLLVAGCALPLPVQVASWVIDGVSYLATRKSVAEHGLSIVTKKDCEVLRGVLGGGLCIDDVVSDTAIAAYEENPADSASLMVATLNAGKVAGFDNPFAALVDDDASFSAAALLDIDIPKIIVALLRDPELLPADAAPRADAFASADASVAAFDFMIDSSDQPIFETASESESDTAVEPSFDDPGGQASAFVVAQADVADLDRIDPATPTEDEANMLANFVLAQADVADLERIDPATPTEDEANMLANFVLAQADVADLERIDPATPTKDEATLLANFSTAAGSSVEDEDTSEALPRNAPETSVFEETRIEIIPFYVAESTADSARRSGAAAETLAAAGATAWVPTKDGLYFVLGSFGYLDNARRAARVFAALQPNIVSAMVKGRKMYRVVVGPFSDANKEVGERLLIDAGISDSWSISLDSTTWTLVKRTQGTADEVASRPTRHDFAK